MGGASALNIEHVIANSEPDRGYIDDVILPLTSWRTSTGLVLNASTDPNITVASDLMYIEWSALDTDAILAGVMLPGHWPDRKDTTILTRREFGLVIQAGVVGAGTNANLALDASIIAIEKGAAEGSALNPYLVSVNGVEEAAPAGGAIIGDNKTADDAPLELVYLWDLETIDPKSSLTIKLVPNEAIGTNLDLRIYGSVARYRRHVCLQNRDDRDPIH